MTLTAVNRHQQRRSTFWWVPAAAGWTVGVIATLSLIASVSPLIRWIIRIPREFVNDYIFNFPDTSFAWAFVLALLAAALAARKSVAWWILVLYMVAAVGWNVVDLAHRRRVGHRGHRRGHRAGLPRRRDRFPGPGPPRVLGEGTARGPDQGSAHARRGYGDRHADRVGSARTLPRIPGPRRPALVCAEPGARLRRCPERDLRRPPARRRERTSRLVRSGGADGRRDSPVPIAAGGERAHR